MTVTDEYTEEGKDLTSKYFSSRLWKLKLQVQTRVTGLVVSVSYIFVTNLKVMQETKKISP